MKHSTYTEAVGVVRDANRAGHITSKETADRLVELRRLYLVDAAAEDPEPAS